MLWVSFYFIWIISQSVAQNILDDTEDLALIGVKRRFLNSLQLTLSSKLLLDIQPVIGHSLSGYLGWLPKRSNITYTTCSDDEESNLESICLSYENGMEVLVTPDDTDTCEIETSTCHAVECYKIEWTSHIGGAMDCFILGEDEWYGGSSDLLHQRWPLEGESRSWSPAVTGDPLHHPSGNIAENFWLTSGGFAIFVDHKTPLFVSFNESGSNRLCFSTSTKRHPYESEIYNRPGLSYSICSASSLLEAYTFGLHRWIKKPDDIPDEIMFQYPVWSTWARYKRSIDEEIVIKFADEIKNADFPASQVEIDDKWEDCYGNLQFDSKRFPNPSAMVSNLNSKSFDTTLWVHPFCNKECDCFNFGTENNFWVKDPKGSTSEVKWWNGDNAAMLDTTNPKAVDWFVGKLKLLRSKYGISSFKFDAGEVLFLNKDFVFHDPKANLQPNLYSKAYAEIAVRFGGRVEVRTGYETQNLPIFVRMFDKFSRWDFTNGLRTLIPNALQLSLMGYFYMLPDMVGGNNYDSINGSLPDRELYIRWLQACVFLPVIQFSIVPWDYDDEVTDIAKKMVLLHEKYHSSFMDAARQSVERGQPIIRPLWWVDPDDIEALKVDTQFLVGDEILVAPVLIKGKLERDIYLPDGKWTDIQRGKTHQGPQWLNNYEAPLNFLPFFIRRS